MNSINPITRMDYPDPDIIRVDDVYYMISTTMHFFPGGAILRSYNLKDWELISYLFDELDDTPDERMERERVIYGAGMYAPSLKYHDGHFYVIFNSHTGEMKTYIYVSENIEGPWRRNEIDSVFYDCALFFDDDGRKYIIYGNRDIRIAELKDDCSGIKENGLAKLLYSDTTDGLGFEGSHVYKHNGYYYIFNINWPKGDIRTQWCHRSKSLDGEFEEKIIFHSGFDFESNGVAQGGFIDTPEGDYYCFLFEDAFSVGRIPVILPMKWENDWPVVGDNGKAVPAKFELPKAKKEVENALYTSDDFSYKKDASGDYILNKQWQWNHCPTKGYWDILPEGGLKITTNKIAINVTHTNNCLTQRMLFPESAATVVVDASNIKDGDVAGIVGLQSLYGYIGIGKNTGNYYIMNMVRNPENLICSKGSGDCMPGELVEQILIDKPIVKLAISAEFGGKEELLHFYYEKDSKWIEIGTPHKMEYQIDHFTGYRFGLFVYSTRHIGGSAIFKNFEFLTHKL